MINGKLFNYIKERIKEGYSIDLIKNSLLDKGWAESDIDDAISSAVQQGQKVLIPSQREVPTKKLPKKLWIILVSAIVIIAIIGTLTFFILPTEKETFKGFSKESSEMGYAESTDCGEDFDCFIEASKDCSPAKILDIISLNMMDLIYTSSILRETKGMESGKCVYNDWYKNYSVKFSEEKTQQLLDSGLTQEEIDKQEQAANEQYWSIIGTGRACKFADTNDLIVGLNNIKQGTISDEGWSRGECREAFFSQNDCTLKSNIQSKGLNLLKGVVFSPVSVTGFKGDPEHVSWLSIDPNIATVNPTLGSSVEVKAVNSGTTAIVAIDNAVGPDCNLSISVKVTVTRTATT